MLNFFKKSITYITLVLGILGVLDFIFLMAFGAVINFGILFPLVVGTVFIVYSILKLKGKFSISKIRNTFVRRSIKITIVTLIISFILIESLIFFSVKTDSYSDVDYAIILGGGLKGGQITLTLQNRLDEGIAFLKNHPDLKVIVSGGKGLGETMSEGEAMANYLVRHGIPAENIIKEERATSTMENFKYTKEILQKQTGRSDYKIMVITSDFHMFRSKILASHNGFTPYGITSDTWPGVLPNSIIREYFAVIKSFIVDILLGI